MTVGTLNSVLKVVMHRWVNISSFVSLLDTKNCYIPKLTLTFKCVTKLEVTVRLA